MKKFLLLTICTLFFSIVSIHAQNYSRLENLTQDLVSSASDLAENASRGIRNGYSNSRSDLENAFLAQQIDASARLFQEMVRNNRRQSELREAAGILSDLIRKGPSYSSNRYWRDVQNSIQDIQREVGSSGGWGNGGGNNGGGWGNNNDNDRKLGSVRWKGTVDKEVHLVIRNNTLTYRLFDGQEYGPGSYTFTSSMPGRNINVYVNKKKGRGGVTVIQQPDRFNDYTAVIKILDSDGGAKEYDVEVYWTK